MLPSGCTVRPRCASGECPLYRLGISVGGNVYRRAPSSLEADGVDVAAEQLSVARDVPPGLRRIVLWATDHEAPFPGAEHRRRDGLGAIRSVATANCDTTSSRHNWPRTMAANHFRCLAALALINQPDQPHSRRVDEGSLRQTAPQRNREPFCRQLGTPPARNRAGGHLITPADGRRLSGVPDTLGPALLCRAVPPRRTRPLPLLADRVERDHELISCGRADGEAR